MKFITLSTILLAGTLAGPLYGSLIVSPISGGISGVAGDTPGWGFSFQEDTGLEWVSFTQSFLVNESNPGLGIYSDLIGPQGGPDNFVVDAGQTWAQAYSLAEMTGLGSFAIDPNAVIGAVDMGLIRVAFDAYSGDPATCSGCLPTPFTVDVPFRVTVSAASATPEPAAALLATLGLFLAGIGRLRRR